MTMLSTLQLDEIASRSDDVDRLVSILAGSHREATREDAFLAWSEHSDTSAASWLIIDRDDDVVAAYDSLIITRIDVALRAAAERLAEGEIEEYAAGLLTNTSIDEDTDVLELRSIRDGDALLGRMRRWSNDDDTLVSTILERFGIEIPDATNYPRSTVLLPLGLDLRDQDGFSA